ncbi:hypothetical protein L9F63_014853, partial [Diploptera punctata]
AVSAKESPYLTEGQMERRKPPFLRAAGKGRQEGRPTGGGRMDPSRSAASGSTEEMDPDALLRQNQDLRRRLQDEAESYRRRLDTYKQSHQNQTALVSRLQAKVLQYKQRCTELEGQISEGLPGPESPVRAKTVSGPPPSLDVREDRIHDLDTALRRLDEEHRKYEKVMQLNATLRDQLEESHQTNDALTADLQKLTNDWEQLREEMLMKEDEWKEEEQAFNDYYTMEHNRLLNVWRDVVSVKRIFAEMKSATERDISKLSSEISSTSREMTNACSGVVNVMQKSSRMEERQQLQHEQEAADLKSQIHSLRTQHEATLFEVRQKEDRIQHLLREIQSLEERCGEAEHEVGQVMRMQEEVELLQTALRDIAHAVIQDAESRDAEQPQTSPHLHLTPAGPVPQRSPKRALRTPTSAAFAESTISAVQAALHKYQLQIHELQVKLQSNKEQLILFKKQCENAEDSQQALETKVGELTVQLDSCRSHCSQLIQEKDLLSEIPGFC